MQQVTGAIFDCDGTLLDTARMWGSLERDLARMAGAQLTPEDSQSLAPMTIPEVAAFFHEKFGLAKSAQDVRRIIDEHMKVLYRDEAQPRPGIPELLAGLVERNIPIAVASSTPKNLLVVGVEGSGLSSYVSAIVSVDDVGHSKRTPHVYEHARKLIGSELSTTWVFEDSPYAVDTAHAGGFKVVGVPDPGNHADPADLKARCDLSFESFKDIDVEVFCAGRL